MIAEITPVIGGAPEVIAIPIENGNETIATMKPGSKVVHPVLQSLQTIGRFFGGRTVVSQLRWMILIGLRVVHD